MTEEVKHKAIELGFDLVGITQAVPIDADQMELLTGWLKSGFAGQMKYMHRNLQKRTDPAKLLEDAKSVICVGLNYKPPERSASLPESRSDARQSDLRGAAAAGKVAHYAQYEDYHRFIRERLGRLIDFVSSIAEAGHKFKICVDSVPLAERTLAARAGLGFIGKNHMLINPKLGGQIFLGEVITTLKLQTDKPIGFDSEQSGLITAKCANCDRCINACPTGALREDGQFDANKCISYLTMEYKGQIPSELAEKIGDRLFGCDECVLACPWQRDAPVCKNKQFKFYDEMARLNLQEVLDMSRQDFDMKLAGSPIKRLGLERLKRNARICLDNAK
ncbi:MAG: tRNA epoxyqueuosine(34) reductase QueG [Planctomycetota bacterium]